MRPVCLVPIHPRDNNINLIGLNQTAGFGYWMNWPSKFDMHPHQYSLYFHLELEVPT